MPSFRKFLFSLVLILTFSGQTYAQVEENLETALQGVVTVAVYKMRDFGKAQLGMKDAHISQVAYAKGLDLAGAESSGSGFMVEKAGQKYVLTNAHVVDIASRDDSSIVVFSVSRKKYYAKLVGGDSFYDLAVLKLTTEPGPELMPLNFASQKPRVGQRVFSIGNPIGQFPYSVSDGIVSALNRVRGGMTGFSGFIQHTATVIWGNSGGPLVNEKGEVLGMNSQIAFANENSVWLSQINFALEADIIIRLLNEILENDGRIKRAYLGLEVTQKYRYKIADDLTIVEDLVDVFPKISGIIPGSSASEQKEQLLNASIILVNEVETRNLEEVLEEFEKVRPGGKVQLTIEKEGERKKVEIIAGELNDGSLVSIGNFLIATEEEVTGFFKPGNRAIVKCDDCSSPGEYHVLYAGIHTETLGSTLWAIVNPSDFGAVLKLCGRNGFMDLIILPKGSEEKVEDLSQLRISFGNEMSVKLPRVYY